MNFTKASRVLTTCLKESVQSVARAAGREMRYLASSRLHKEDLVRELLAREGLTEGIVCVLSCLEPCQSYNTRRNRETMHLDIVPAQLKCLHWYVYFMDDVLGLCHVRIHSWLPFNGHVCVNGRKWPCRQLTTKCIDFTRSDNTLPHVSDIEAGQALLDAQPWANWSGLLNGRVKRSCP